MTGEETPWARARVSVDVWERAFHHATIEYEAAVRAVAERFEQADHASWLEARDQAAVARRRIAAISRGDRTAIDETLRDRRSWRR